MSTLKNYEPKLAKVDRVVVQSVQHTSGPKKDSETKFCC
jgi:hypothetical protein